MLPVGVLKSSVFIASFIFKELGAGQNGLVVKKLLYKPDELSSTGGSHKVVGENYFSRNCPLTCMAPTQQ